MDGSIPSHLGCDLGSPQIQAVWLLLFAQQNCKFIEALVKNHPSLFVDQIRRKLYNNTVRMPSLSTIKIELRALLLLTLKKACVSNVRKSLVAKYTWMG